MKYRTLELIGSLILAGVAAAMATKAHAADVDECLAYAQFARAADVAFDNGASLESVVRDIVSVPGSEQAQRTLIRLAVNAKEYHRHVTPAEAYSLTFDVCMRVTK